MRPSVNPLGCGENRQRRLFAPPPLGEQRACGDGLVKTSLGEVASNQTARRFDHNRLWLCRGLCSALYAQVLDSAACTLTLRCHVTKRRQQHITGIRPLTTATPAGWSWITMLLIKEYVIPCYSDGIRPVLDITVERTQNDRGGRQREPNQSLVPFVQDILRGNRTDT